MKSTSLIYLKDSYKKKHKTKILDIIEDGKQTSLVLKETIFYPQGGGQPADQGVIESKNGKLIVSHVSYNNGLPLHKGSVEGHLEIGDEIALSIDWDVRYKNMQLHTAGHILDQALKNVKSSATAIAGNHGIGKKTYLELDKKIPVSELDGIQTEINKIISQDLKIKTEMVDKQEIEKRKIKVPFKLPENKPLRIMSIGKYDPAPDGGTQLKTTGESWKIKIDGLVEKKGKYLLNYKVDIPTEENIKQPTKLEKKQTTKTSTENLQKQISSLLQQFQNDPELDVKKLSIKYLGKKGLFKKLAQEIRNVDSANKKQAGQLLNKLKNQLENDIEKLNQTAKEDWVDLTTPGLKPKLGHMHPISQAIEEVANIFEKIGFTRVRYPEVDWDYYAFESLNMPKDHPARDEWETFFIESLKKEGIVAEDNKKKKGKIVLTPHTSNGQVREMERLKSKPPIRMVNIARCYRRQQDVTHTQMFHQFEGLVVDEGINIQHLKGTLDYFAQEFYGPGTKSRIRPFHFQFTEPSFEVDFSCHICHGTGLVKGERGDKNKCTFCKSGWHEVGGAGMVHPNVLKAGGIDPNKYTGFAFGWGVERTYTLREGLNIDDIRLLYSGDVRFLEQF